MEPDQYDFHLEHSETPGIGGSDRYTLAFNQEGIEFGKAEGFENPGELEESKLENFVFGTETEEVLGSQTGTN